MAITETTPAVEARWPRVVWLVLGGLAIGIGGGLGYIVALDDDEPSAEHAQAMPVTIEPIAAPAVATPPTAPASVPAAPTPEPGEPEPAAQAEPTRPNGGSVRRPIPKPKQKPKLKPTPCNVYDHMDGC